MDEQIGIENPLNTQNEDDDSETIENVEESDLSLEEKTAKLAETNKKLFARAKKAEQELKAFKQSSVEKVETPTPVISKPSETDVDKRVREILEERDLDAMEISDESKIKIRAYAKANGISIREVVRSDYYEFLTQKETSAKKSEDASIGGKRVAPSSNEFSLDTPPKVDMFTKEGLEIYDKWKEWRKTQV
jgi:hypothetical protein